MGIGYFVFICPYWEGQINLILFLRAGSAGAAIAAQRTQSAPGKR